MEFSPVISKAAPPVFWRGGPSTGSVWWHKGGAGEPWRPLPFVRLSIKLCNCRLHNCCEQPWCLHDPLQSSLASAHLPQLSQRNQPNPDLTAPRPHWNGLDFQGSEWGQDLAQDLQGWSKLVWGAADKSLPLCWSFWLRIPLRFHCHHFLGWSSN